MPKIKHQNKKILAIIPARGKSKRLPHKNIKIMAGKPLIAYTIIAARKSRHINRIIVSTENRKIAEISKKYGAEVLKRPKSLAKDNIEVRDVVLSVLKVLEKEKYIPELVVILQPTSPLKTGRNIDEAIENFSKNKNKCEVSISVCETKYPLQWLFRVRKKILKPLFSYNCFSENSQGKEKIYVPNGAIYIAKSRIFKKNKNLNSKKILPYFMPKETIIDIDDKLDFAIAEKLMKKEL